MTTLAILLAPAEPRAALRDVAQRVIGDYLARRERKRQLAGLLELDGYLLRDVGLDRSQVRAALAK